MSGKKAAITVVSVLFVAVILIVIAFQVFFATYEPRKSLEGQSYNYEMLNEEKTTDLL